ncbi:Rap1a/Tai family immunity protein [Stenotrophomonas sp. AG209]|uniref:Rap1a/Tai family immunity protein n=1 Tax=Stenotrophomonas sp. AG209 TaxID=2183909 RepID=UPI002870AC25|nr:Rap1a/Tai family immunity protein [Stenotrophomonas sp. AG209]
MESRRTTTKVQGMRGHQGRQARRRMSRLLTLGACFLAGSLLAETSPPKRTWLVSGAELITLLQGKGADGFCAGEQCRNLSSARASAYIQGAADANRGQWCGQGQILPHELVDRVASHLQQLPQDRLQQNASSLVVEGLRTAFPCERRASRGGIGPSRRN